MASRKYLKTKFPENIRCNVWLISFILLGLSCTALSTPTLRWYKNTTSDYKEYTLDNATAVLTTDYYNSEQNITIYVYGFAQRANSTEVTSVPKEYLKRNDRLVVLLQYDDEANTYLSPLLDALNTKTILINYPAVVLASKQVADALANALCELYKAGVDLKRIHIVGHSLGAHIGGNAGTTLKKCTGGIGVYRATGLDPASYGFQEPVVAMESIGKDSADFVDIIHTDPSNYGNKNDLGHCDFWVNEVFYQNHKYQPGCKDSTNMFCSHQLSVELWKEAIADPTIVVASGEGNKITYVGDNTDRTARGRYSVCTNDGSPYAKGAAGADPSQCLT